MRRLKEDRYGLILVDLVQRLVISNFYDLDVSLGHYAVSAHIVIYGLFFAVIGRRTLNVGCGGIGTVGFVYFRFADFNGLAFVKMLVCIADGESFSVIFGEFVGLYRSALHVGNSVVYRELHIVYRRVFI